MESICYTETSVDTGLNGVLSHKIELFTATAVRNWNPGRIVYGQYVYPASIP
jgi:hypothetical protein